MNYEPLPNEPCPCGSGHKFKKCCVSKDFKFVRQENGSWLREVPIKPVLKEILEKHKAEQEKQLGRPVGKADLVFPGFDAKVYEKQLIEIMLSLNHPFHMIWAFKKTGLLVSEMNINIIPTRDVEEWEAAVKEGERLESRLSQEELNNLLAT